MKDIRTHYIDTSALVKLLLDEPGSDKLRNYFEEHSVFSTTSLCLAEALGVLKKRIFLEEKDSVEYYNLCYELIAYLRHGNITIDDAELFGLSTYNEVEKTAKKYDLDISDAFQIVSLKKSIISKLGGESRGILITGDSQLAKAAREESLRAWDIMKEDEPPKSE